ncbi:aspartate/glutamate racemase family protein [Candidatus Roizmanbacteria bacterium]|nr:aspartate/glutamate racemase family protein [Candidatus Roizmanbacteria bacterium]
MNIEMNTIPKLSEQLKIPGQVHIPLVVSGIGPESGKDFVVAAVRQNTGAKRDQDHLGYGLAMATGIPDRTAALKAKAVGNAAQYEDIRTRLLHFAYKGRQEGFDYMITLCNTIHAWRGELKDHLQEIGIPWMSIMDAVAADLRLRYDKGTRIGVFATTGTLMTGLYRDALTQVGLQPVEPDLESDVQNTIMAAIYDEGFGIKKAGATPEAKKLLLQAAQWANHQNLEVVIEGCTEIPLALNSETYNGTIALINPMDALASVALKYSFDGTMQFPG